MTQNPLEIDFRLMDRELLDSLEEVFNAPEKIAKKRKR
jgi:hypothetical protein